MTPALILVAFGVIALVSLLRSVLLAEDVAELEAALARKDARCKTLAACVERCDKAEKWERGQ